MSDARKKRLKKAEDFAAAAARAGVVLRPDRAPTRMQLAQIAHEVFSARRLAGQRLAGIEWSSVIPEIREDYAAVASALYAAGRASMRKVRP